MLPLRRLSSLFSPDNFSFLAGLILVPSIAVVVQLVWPERLLMGAVFGVALFGPIVLDALLELGKPPQTRHHERPILRHPDWFRARRVPRGVGLGYIVGLLLGWSILALLVQPLGLF